MTHHDDLTDEEIYEKGIEEYERAEAEYEYAKDEAALEALEEEQ